MVGMYNNYYSVNDIYYKASLIKVIYVVVIDAVLGFSIHNKLKLRANNLRILLEYPLTVLYSIKYHFKLI